MGGKRTFTTPVGAYDLNARVLAGGAAIIDVSNRSGGALAEAIVLGFAVVKASTT